MGIGLTVTATLVAILLASFYIYLRRLRSYWSRRNVPTVGGNVFYGIHRRALKLEQTLGESYRDAYKANRDKRYYGTYLFGKPTLVVQDPEILKHILVKDFSNFNSHGLYTNPEKDPLSGHLFNLQGSRWKSMRTKLTATFTSGKLKYMFDTLQECINRLYEVIGKEIEETGNVRNMKDKLACLGTDIIASVAFGIEANSLDNPDAEFRKIGRLVFSPTFKTFLRASLMLNAHWFVRLFNIKITSSRPYNFIMGMVKNTVEYREKNNVQRNDFLNMLIQLKNKGFVEGEGKDAVNENPAIKRITLDEVAAQVWVFYLAGFETTSTLTTFTLYELSVHKDIQRKVQEECDRVLRESGGKVTYEGIQSMEYTDKVIHETLRFYPAVGALLRSPLRDCKLPTTDIVLEKGIQIAIPTFGLHADPLYYPDPEKFDPERFSEEQKASRLPYTYMPFGEGPRICIGMRFGLLQVKSVLLGLLARYNFDLTDDTPVPIKLEPRASVTSPQKVDFVITKRETTVI